MHGREALFKVGVVEPVGDDRRQVQAALDHVAHLVPVVHLPAVDALEGQALADDQVHIEVDGSVPQAQQGDLAAVAHDGQHLLQSRAAAGHLKAHVEALHQPLFMHDLGEVRLADVHRRVRAHLPGQVQPILVHVRDDHPPGARVLADAHGDDADGASAGDEHVLAHQVEHEGRVGGVAEGVEEGDHVLVQLGVDDDDVAGGDAHVLREGAVPIHAHAVGVLAPLDVAGVAVAAVAAGDVALAADPHAHLKAGDAGAQLRDLAHVLVADDHGGLHMLRGPGGPVVDMHVGAADGGLMDLDEHLTGAGHGHGHLPKLQTDARHGLNNGIHHLLSHTESKPSFHSSPGFIGLSVIFFAANTLQELVRDDTD